MHRKECHHRHGQWKIPAVLRKYVYLAFIGLINTISFSKILKVVYLFYQKKHPYCLSSVVFFPDDLSLFFSRKINLIVRCSISQYCIINIHVNSASLDKTTLGGGKTNERCQHTNTQACMYAWRHSSVPTWEIEMGRCWNAEEERTDRKYCLRAKIFIFILMNLSFYCFFFS